MTLHGLIQKLDASKLLNVYLFFIIYITSSTLEAFVVDIGP